MLREKVGDGKVLLALSGGVDSSVAAALLAKAVGEQLTCIFVDHGLMRKNEGDEVEAAFPEVRDVNFVRVNAEQRFLEQAGRRRRSRSGSARSSARSLSASLRTRPRKSAHVDYPGPGDHLSRCDRVRHRAMQRSIKSHHNVGGLPDYVDFKEIIEPLRMLFKDEVRQLGRELGLPEYLVMRQPFPGPGLAIRVIGEITKEKLDILRDADFHLPGGNRQRRPGILISTSISPC